MVFLWVQRRIEAYYGDIAQIYAAGDSTGGNLAVVLSSWQQLNGLMLFCPMETLLPEGYGKSWNEFTG
jgi:acetyl esterase/lipase